MNTETKKEQPIDLMLIFNPYEEKDGKHIIGLGAVQSAITFPSKEKAIEIMKDALYNDNDSFRLMLQRILTLITKDISKDEEKVI